MASRPANDVVIDVTQALYTDQEIPDARLPVVARPAYIAPGFFQLLRRAELPLSMQCRVTGIAIVLEITQIFELIRLRAGFTVERR